MKPKFKNDDNTRRSFLKKTAAATVIFSTSGLVSLGAKAPNIKRENSELLPWKKVLHPGDQ
ncbi:MAG: twin-arginine translocation signal domain-containing protein [Ginsengibacter sp.]